MMRKHKGYPVYPLTVAQKFHLFYLPYCPSAAVMNIGTRLTIQSEIDWDLLKQSIYQAYDRCEGMRVRFAKDKDGTYYQYNVSGLTPGRQYKVYISYDSTRYYITGGLKVQGLGSEELTTIENENTVQ